MGAHKAENVKMPGDLQVAMSIYHKREGALIIMKLNAESTGLEAVDKINPGHFLSHMGSFRITCAVKICYFQDNDKSLVTAL